jgi:hypothetical protein
VAQNSKSSEGWGSLLLSLFFLVGGFWWVADYAWDKIAKFANKPAVASTTAAGVTAPITPAAPKPSGPQLLDYPTGQLDLIGLTMSKSRAFIATGGDLRPLWTVRGRIKNHTAPAVSIKEIRLHIRIYDAAGEEADSALLTVRTLIPPQDTVSFEENIQVMPPDGKWSWMCDLEQAVVAPEQ